MTGCRLQPSAEDDRRPRPYPCSPCTDGSWNFTVVASMTAWENLFHELMTCELKEHCCTASLLVELQGMTSECLPVWRTYWTRCVVFLLTSWMSHAAFVFLLNRCQVLLPHFDMEVSVPFTIRVASLRIHSRHTLSPLYIPLLFIELNLCQYNCNSSEQICIPLAEEFFKISPTGLSINMTLDLCDCCVCL